MSTEKDRIGGDTGPRLFLVEGSHAERVIPLEDPTVVGRQSGCRVRLPSKRVSRQHCRLFKGTGGWTIEDLGSHNGTFVNEMPVSRRALLHGDRLRVSSWSFVFVEHTGGDSPAPQPAISGLQGSVSEVLTTSEALDFETRLRQQTDSAVVRQSLRQLLELTRLLARLDSNEVLHGELLPQLTALLEAEGAAFSLDFAGSHFLEEPAERTDREPLSVLARQLVDRVTETGDGMVLLASEAPSERPPREHSLAAVPLLTELGEPLGVLVVWRRQPPALSRSSLETLSALAGLLAPALLSLRDRLALEYTVTHSDFGLLGDSDSMQSVRKTLAQVAPTDATVLIRGETGTGKELAARALHQQSARRGHPFVAINCAALSPQLLESELFGHEKGAFTGAVARKLGRIEQADGGTLFLDEIAELPIDLQAKLLRVLESWELQRVGSERTLRVDVRLLAATHQPLEQRVEEGRFRQDLFYRLNVIEIHLAPLHRRPEDVRLLAQHFLRTVAARMGRPNLRLEHGAVAILQSYRWPGNARELRNVIERVAILSSSEVLTREDFHSQLAVAGPLGSAPGSYKMAVRDFRRRFLRAAVDQCEGNVSLTAKKLGLSPNYLHRLLTDLDLRRR